LFRFYRTAKDTTKQSENSAHQFFFWHGIEAFENSTTRFGLDRRPVFQPGLFNRFPFN
jgi:hypothetical protein